MHIYLSPHYDDVCFSIGHIAGRFAGDLVNLFTVGRYVAANLALPSDDASRVEVVSQLRRQEDQLFVHAAGLVRHDLGLQEPPQMGLASFDITNLKAEVAALKASLTPCLLAMLPSEGDPSAVNVYCPMGIGGHRNHLSTLLAVWGAYDWLRHRCTLFLYEDLHYASVSPMRQAGLRRAARIFAGTQLSPIVVPLQPRDAERKMQWIGFYASQHASSPRVNDFTPASGMASGLHEIIWQVSPSPGVQA
jgi:hypothetical protein